MVTRDELWQSVVSGEPAGMTQLHDRCLIHASRLCPRYGLLAQEAPDVAGEFFLRLIQPPRQVLHRYSGQMPFDTWLWWRLRGFLSHLARQRIRRGEVLLAPQLMTSVLDDRQRTADEPAAGLMASSFQDELARALTRLDENDRQLFQQRAMQELGYAEIAARSGTSEPLLWKRYERVRQRLRRLL